MNRGKKIEWMVGDRQAEIGGVEKEGEGRGRAQTRDHNVTTSIPSLLAVGPWIVAGVSATS